jgi:hypothetical protein
MPVDEQTVLVPLSYVLFKSAAITDARAVIDKAHHVGGARHPRRLPGRRRRADGPERLGTPTSPSADR